LRDRGTVGAALRDRVRELGFAGNGVYILELVIGWARLSRRLHYNKPPRLIICRDGYIRVTASVNLY